MRRPAGEDPWRCCRVEALHLWTLPHALFPTEILAESPTGSGISFHGEDYADGDEVLVGASAAQSISYPVPEECDADLAPDACNAEAPQWTVTPSVPAP
ncbi:hypothetical protein ACHABQ_05990 [Nesterenkonia aurantiaca]|uniref:hypothetical protein n=1 Tax=Nesterenkonia aurantiaca TaxID=1436010 RepID=UPI003EE7E5E0